MNATVLHEKMVFKTKFRLNLKLWNTTHNSSWKEIRICLTVIYTVNMHCHDLYPLILPSWKIPKPIILTWHNMKYIKVEYFYISQNSAFISRFTLFTLKFHCKHLLPYNQNKTKPKVYRSYLPSILFNSKSGAIENKTSKEMKSRHTIISPFSPSKIKYLQKETEIERSYDALISQSGLLIFLSISCL